MWWLLDFLWGILQDFLVWGFLAKRVLRWLTPRSSLLARLRAQHEEYIDDQLSSQRGNGRDISSRNASTYSRSTDRLPLKRQIELHFSLWLWGGALK